MILVQISFASFIKNHFVTKPSIIILFMLLPQLNHYSKGFYPKKKICHPVIIHIHLLIKIAFYHMAKFNCEASYGHNYLCPATA